MDRNRNGSLIFPARPVASSKDWRLVAAARFQWSAFSLHYPWTCVLFWPLAGRNFFAKYTGVPI